MPNPTRARRRVATVTALVCASCLAGATAVPAVAAKKPPPVVGTATAVTKTVTVSGPGVTPHRLAAGEKLRLGAKLIVRARATVTLKIRRPASVPATTDLVLIGSPKGVRITIRSHRQGAFTIVRVTPTPTR